MVAKIATIIFSVFVSQAAALGGATTTGHGHSSGGTCQANWSPQECGGLGLTPVSLPAAPLLMQVSEDPPSRFTDGAPEEGVVSLLQLNRVAAMNTATTGEKEEQGDDEEERLRTNQTEYEASVRGEQLLSRYHETEEDAQQDGASRRRGGGYSHSFTFSSSGGHRRRQSSRDSGGGGGSSSNNAELKSEIAKVEKAVGEIRQELGDVEMLVSKNLADRKEGQDSLEGQVGQNADALDKLKEEQQMLQSEVGEMADDLAKVRNPSPGGAGRPNYGSAGPAGDDNNDDTVGGGNDNDDDEDNDYYSENNDDSSKNNGGGDNNNNNNVNNNDSEYYSENNGDDDAGEEGAIPKTKIERWLAAHNYHRCVHGAGPLKWDAGIAKGSQKWADRGQMSHADCYSLKPPEGGQDGRGTGENLAMGSHINFQKAVEMWYDENPETGPNGGGHFTAMVWKSSTKLGCNTKPGPGGLMVCRYADAAANFGSKQGQVGYPTKSDKKKKECKKKFPYDPPPKDRWR